jgi:outer membrane protein assembly factor BamB
LACDPDGYIYAGADDGKVRKLNPSTGAVIWTSADFGSNAHGLTTNYYAGWGM